MRIDIRNLVVLGGDYNPRSVAPSGTFHCSSRYGNTIRGRASQESVKLNALYSREPDLRLKTYIAITKLQGTKILLFPTTAASNLVIDVQRAAGN